MSQILHIPGENKRLIYLVHSYKHAVITSLVNPELLRSVREEIQNNITFTPKETDIYKIFQSGDLANLDGLDDASLEKLPSLLKLRDALYSAPFRNYLSTITGAGKLSGSKTDMAVNVYTGGSHLLCHDDVIGSRRISYILYLTHPDHPWQAEWGGALRLFPTKTVKDEEGNDIKIPEPDHTVSIPPAFNQLSFFAVQPGESFHDVEEVYRLPDEGDSQDVENRKTRMAISGWFHIPQEGEDGFEEGLEEKLAKRSTLQQLQGPADEYDRPQPNVIDYDDDDDEGEENKEAEEALLTEEDLDFLLKYMTPMFLTPDTMEQITENFQMDSQLRLETFLGKKFAEKLKAYIETEEKKSLPETAPEIESKTEWKVARPPHKQRFLYQQATSKSDGEKNPLQELLEDFLPSPAFKKWLSLATGIENLVSHDVLARRFRKGSDYTLASGYKGEVPRLEFTLGITPTDGWGDDDDEDEDDQDGAEETAQQEGLGQSKGKGKGKASEADEDKEDKDEIDVGGYEAYMAGDDDDDDEEDEDEEDGDDANPKAGKSSKPKADPAIYRAADDEEDDGILFSMPAGWNRFSLVLRDRGTLKFVKYVSRSAKGDRWDITGDIELAEEALEELDEEELAALMAQADELDGEDDDEDDEIDDDEGDE